MMIRIIFNDLRDAINLRLDEASHAAGLCIPAEDRAQLFNQLVDYFDNHGQLPDFTIARKEGPTDQGGGIARTDRAHARMQECLAMLSRNEQGYRNLVEGNIVPQSFYRCTLEYAEEIRKLVDYCRREIAEEEGAAVEAVLEADPTLPEFARESAK